MVEEISKQALATKLMLDMKTSVLQVKQGEEISSVVQIPKSYYCLWYFHSIL